MAVDGQVDLISTVFFEFKAVDIEDKIGGGRTKVGAWTKGYLAFEFRGDVVAVFIDYLDSDGMIALFDGLKTDSCGNRALGMFCGQLFSPDIIEGAEDIQFALLFGGGVT